MRSAQRRLSLHHRLRHRRHGHRPLPRHPRGARLVGLFGRTPLSVTPLPFIERYSNTLLHQHDVETQTLWPLETLMGQMTHQVLALAPDSFWDSVFTRYMRGSQPGAGYKHFPQSLTLVQEHIDRADGPTYTYIYCPEPDTTSHDFGWGQPPNPPGA